MTAYLGRKDIVDSLRFDCYLIMGSEVMAILSGKIVGDELRDLTESYNPTYDSIRYAIHSGNVTLLRQLKQEYHLKLSSDHFVVAASQDSVAMFNFLLDKGLNPEGSLVMEAALEEKSDEIVSLLENA